MTNLDSLRLRALYDQHMRRDSWVLAFDKTLTADTSRYVARNGEVALLMWHHFGAIDLTDRVAAELTWFRARAKSLNWKVYGHDQPEGLGAVLAAAGGEAEDFATLHMAKAADVCERLGPANEGIHLLSGATRKEVMRAKDVWVNVWPETAHEQAVWGEAYASALDASPNLTDAQQGANFWTAMSGNASEPSKAEAVGAGYMIHAPSLDGNPSPIALLCGGAVREAARGKGVYKALLRARAQWALTRGAEFIAIEASPMSAPIVQSLGFEPITPLVFYKFDF